MTAGAARLGNRSVNRKRCCAGSGGAHACGAPGPAATTSYGAGCGDGASGSGCAYGAPGGGGGGGVLPVEACAVVGVTCSSAICSFVTVTTSPDAVRNTTRRPGS
jgi:hypothetical protein